MLRRARKRDLVDGAETHDKTRKRKHKRSGSKRVPLGTARAKESAEEALESAVLGGEDQLIEELEIQPITENEKKSKKRRVPSLGGDGTRPAAWEDEDDIKGYVKLPSKRRQAVVGQGEKSQITNEEYSQHLKTKFEKISSAPNWAKLPTEMDKLDDEEDSDVDELLHRTGDYLTQSASLPRDILQIKQLTDGNKQNPVHRKLTSLEFHPTARVLLTGSLNNSLSLFQVDGKTNPKIQTVYQEGYPIHTAHFTADGMEVVMGSRHKGFVYYDMIAGKIVKVPAIKGLGENNMKHFEVSPDGRFLVFRGEYGSMHLISAKSKEWIHSLKMNGSVESVAFSHDGQKMFSHGDDGQVYVWDMNTRDCIHRFYDDGCLQGTSIAVSANSQYLACGSSSGVVNLYETEKCLASTAPRPLKAIMNLTTSCTCAKFNPTSEILAISSDQTQKAVKLVHVPSLSVFSNFPEQTDTSIHYPQCLDFSVNSGYFTLGTQKGRALLYRLKHYGNY